MMNKDAILIQVTPHIERPYTITIGEAKKRLSEVNERYETFECNEEYCEYHDEVNSLTLALYGPPKEEQANNVGDIPF